MNTANAMDNAKDSVPLTGYIVIPDRVRLIDRKYERLLGDCSYTGSS